MDEITALGQEYLKREDTFHAFADGFLKWATDHCPSFEKVRYDRTEVTFRFLGRRLRIRHSFTVEDQEIFTTEDIRANERLTSRLDLLEAGNDPDKDVVFPSLSGMRRDGCVPLVVAHPHNSGRQLRGLLPYTDAGEGLL